MKTQKSERLNKRIHKTGIKASIKAGHVITEPELRKLKVQIFPLHLRLFFAFISILFFMMAFKYIDHRTVDLIFYSLSILFTLSAIVGFKKTVESIFEGVDSVMCVDMYGAILSVIIDSVGDLFDGV